MPDESDAIEELIGEDILGDSNADTDCSGDISKLKEGVSELKEKIDKSEPEVESKDSDSEDSDTMYKVYRTETFDKRVKKLSKGEREQITHIENQLKTNPFVGKPLGYRFFREKKIRGKRIYYLVYEDIVIVLLVALSDKKTQQAPINKIKGKLPEYYNAIKEILQKR